MFLLEFLDSFLSDSFLNLTFLGLRLLSSSLPGTTIPVSKTRLTEEFDLAALSRAGVDSFYRMTYNSCTHYQQDGIIGAKTDLPYIFRPVEYMLTCIPSNNIVLGLAAFGRTYELKDPASCATQEWSFLDGRIFTINKAAYKVFGWSVCKFIGSYTSMIVGKDQYFKWYLETRESHIEGKQYNAPNHLDETFVLAQGVKVSHNILNLDSKSTIIFEQNGTASSFGNTQHVNIRFLMKNRVASNKFEIEDCPTKQMLDDLSIKEKILFELRKVIMERKLSDAFKECVGCILHIQSFVPSNVIHRDATGVYKKEGVHNTTKS